MTRITWTALLGLAVVVAMAVPAQAVVVKNTTTGRTIFKDSGFENVAPGNAPVADIGTWLPNTTGGGATVVSTDTPAPGAFDGNNWLYGNKHATTNNWFAKFDPAPTTGQRVRAEFMVRFILDVNYNSSFGFAKSIGGGFHLSQGTDQGTGIFDPFANTKPIPDGTITKGPNGQWHKVTTEYTANVGNATIAIDDGPAFAFASGTDIPIALHFGAGNSGVAYGLDAVPEPATLGLLGLGGFVMLKRRRRAA